MDLMRLLRSLEEFLYELIGWLVSYPRTFWRILRHPGAIARYTRKELAEPPEQQFQETISPVLMLILSVVLAHAMEMALRLPTQQTESPLGRLLFGTEQSLLLTRSIIFCFYALGAALGTLIRERKPITRETLREPFSVQAFLACPFVLILSLGLRTLLHDRCDVSLLNLVSSCNPAQTPPVVISTLTQANIFGYEVSTKSWAIHLDG